MAPCESLNGIGCRRPRFAIPRAAWRARTAERSLWRNWTAGEETNCSVVELMLLTCFQLHATLASQTKSEPTLLEWESDTSTIGIWSSTVVRILSSSEYTSEEMYTPLYVHKYTFDLYNVSAYKSIYHRHRAGKVGMGLKFSTCSVIICFFNCQIKICQKFFTSTNSKI